MARGPRSAVVASRAMQESTFTLPSDDGVALHVYRWSPDEGVAPRAVLQVSHGLAEHAARYRRFAEAATARGLVVYADDHRGHGRTARSDAELGVFSAERGWRKLIDDLGRVSERALAEHPGLPVVFLGHSMGSFTAQQVAFERGGDFAGVILSATISGRSNPLAPIGRVVARLERWRIGASTPSALLDTMSFGSFNRAFKPARTAFDWLSRDPAEVDAYVADPRCGFKLSAQGWIDLLDALKDLADPANQARVPKELPLLLIAGEADPVVGGLKFFERLVAEYNAAGLRRLTWKVYAGARHELLNETNRDEVTRDVLDWIDKVALGGA
jgi:alpha-beta hydrolase superfamily lysophospholipase